MKEVIHKYEQLKMVSSIKWLMFALLCVIILGNAMTQGGNQTLQYTLYLTLPFSLIFLAFFRFDISLISFFTGKAGQTARPPIETFDYLNTLIATSPILLFAMRMQKGQLSPEWVSDNIVDMLGYSKKEALQPDWWLKHLHPQDKERVLENTLKLFQGEPVACDYRFLHKNGSEVWVHDEQRLVCDERGRIIRVVNTWTDITRQKIARLEQGITMHMFNVHEGSISVDADLVTRPINPIFNFNHEEAYSYDAIDLCDITDRNEIEKHIRMLAFYDPLTKLPNRRLLLERITQAISDSAISRRHGALLILDLDRFKILNDTYGHNMGDILLLEVARRLQLSTRPQLT